MKNKHKRNEKDKRKKKKIIRRGDEEREGWNEK